MDADVFALRQGAIGGDPPAFNIDGAKLQELSSLITVQSCLMDEAFQQRVLFSQIVADAAFCCGCYSDVRCRI